MKPDKFVDTIIGTIIAILILIAINGCEKVNAQNTLPQVKEFKQQGDLLYVETNIRLNLKKTYQISIETTSGALYITEAKPTGTRSFRLNQREIGINQTVSYIIIIKQE